MKKSFLFVALLCTTILVATSCSEESKFKAFAIDFAHAVNSGDTAKIDTMLAQPHGYQFCQVNLAKINPDSLILIEVGEGKYQITSVGDIKMMITKVGEKMVVDQTWKIFGGEPENVSFALKHNLIKENDDDKTIYGAVHSEEYAKAKETELAEQKFAQEKEAAQKVIGKTLVEFDDIVTTLQGLYNTDPASLWWSMNQPVLTAADEDKCTLDKLSKYMTPEQLDKFKKLARQYNRMINS